MTQGVSQDAVEIPPAVRATPPEIARAAARSRFGLPVGVCSAFAIAITVLSVLSAGVVAATTAFIAAVLIAVPIGAAVMGSTLMMVACSRGVSRLECRTLLWAMTYAREELRTGTAPARAKGVTRLVRLWLWRLDARERDLFYSLVTQSTASLGEIRDASVRISASRAAR